MSSNEINLTQKPTMPFITKIWQHIKSLFKQGLSPRDLALSIAVAMLISVIPVLGITTILLTAVALPLRLNLPIMIAVSYTITPLQIALVVPFITMGATLFGTEHYLITFEAIKESFDFSFWITIKDLSFELLCGLAGWLLTAAPMVLLIFMGLKLIFVKFQNKNQFNYH